MENAKKNFADFKFVNSANYLKEGGGGGDQEKVFNFTF